MIIVSTSIAHLPGFSCWFLKLLNRPVTQLVLVRMSCSRHDQAVAGCRAEVGLPANVLVPATGVKAVIGYLRLVPANTLVLLAHVVVESE